MQIEYFSGVCLNFKASGYSSIENCQFRVAGYDCIWLESYNLNDACISKHIDNSEVSGGFRSSFHLSNTFNIKMSRCQIEQSRTALLVDGMIIEFDLLIIMLKT